MLSFGWSSLVLLFPSPFTSLWWLFRTHQLQLVSPSLSCSIVFSVLYQGLGIYLSFRFLWFLLCGLPERQNQLFGRFSFFLFLLTITRSDHLAEIGWSVYISKSQRSLCVSFSRADSWLSIYHSFIWLNFNFLHNSQCFPHPVVFSLILFFAIICCIRSLSDWSFRLYHLIIYICYFVASILALILVVLMALFSSAISRDSISLLIIPFLSHVQVFLCEISLICRSKCPYSCFSSYFCFLVYVVLLILALSALFLVAFISLPLCFFM